MEIAFCLILFLFCCILKPLHILYMLLFLLPTRIQQASAKLRNVFVKALLWC